MGKKRVMVPAADVDLSAVKYQNEAIQAPHLTGLKFKLFVKLLETPLIGPLIISHLKKENNMIELLQNTVIPEAPMYRPEYPPQESETGVVVVDEDGKPEDRVELAMKCLPPYNAASSWNEDLASSFRYWKIRDYAHAYRSKFVTPSMVAEQIIPVIEEFNKKDPPMPLLISFDAEEVRKQAAASTKRFEEGSPISILDGIFIAIKDDIDLYPHPSKGATTWMHEVRPVKEDAISVSRLRSCGVIFVGKANMHEFGMGTTGNNPNYGTTRNPHAVDRYTGGSSSGPAAIVASGLCSAALGTDGGGSIRIPSSLCGVVGLKTTFGRTNITGSLYDFGTVEVTGPIASSVEDVMLVYAAILGSRPEERISLNPSPPCLPNLASRDGADALGSLRLGKYTAWFNDVQSTDVSDTCEDMLNLLSRTHGCEMVEIVIPELQEMRTAHLVSIGSEFINSLIPDIEDGKGVRLNYDSRTSVGLFRSFGASDYIAAQCLRRRLMHHHMEIFKKVDVIVTPTTGMTAPKIRSSALSYGETDLQTSGYLMRFVIAANLLGFPAISIPVGYDKQGLPIGLQLIGRPWGEATLLRLASAVEELYAKPKKRPASFYDVLKTK
ncbi:TRANSAMIDASE [Salix koriyanagi]|uniref:TRANSAMIDASE n=1 Tax=Salix koriyanagi TaxID=2511006 RepID=A0A9Q0X4W0_9ROSI|nr:TRANSAMIDASE [Salix koriyanagi]